MTDFDPTPTAFKSRLKRFGKRLIHSENMLRGIGVASFLESLIVPIPLETILIPLLQARRERMFLISTIVLAGCLLGAIVGYGIGHLMFEAVGSELVSYFSSAEQFEKVRKEMNEKGFWFILSMGITPLPFQIAMLAAGVTGYSCSC